MNDTYTGGVGSFLLCSMVISFLQMKLKTMQYTDLTPRWNLGALLMEFFYHYGVTFNYFHTGISITDGGKYFPKASFNTNNTNNDIASHNGNGNGNGNGNNNESRPGILCVENPDSPELDMGRNSYLMNKVKRSFEHAYQLLVVALNDPRQATYLGYVIRGDDPVLVERAARAPVRK